MAFVFAPLFSGSSGNALCIVKNDTTLLVDAGLPGRRIAQEMEKAGCNINNLQGIWVTHEHSDHIAGVGVLMRKYHVPVWATAATWQAMQGKIGAIPQELVRFAVPGESVWVGDLSVTPFPIPHDAADPVGYTCTDGKTKLSIATDVGCIADDWMQAVEGSDFLLLEANHDVDMLKAGSYSYDLKRRILGKQGHLSNDDAGVAAARLCSRGVRRILLGHLSGDNNFPQLAWESVALALRQNSLDIPLGVASRSGLSGPYVLDEGEKE